MPIILNFHRENKKRKNTSLIKNKSNKSSNLKYKSVGDKLFSSIENIGIFDEKSNEADKNNNETILPDYNQEKIIEQEYSITDNILNDYKTLDNFMKENKIEKKMISNNSKKNRFLRKAMIFSEILGKPKSLK